jgi:hypothetical protein
MQIRSKSNAAIVAPYRPYNWEIYDDDASVLGKFRIDLSGLPGDFPTIHSSAQADIDYECAVVAPPTPQQRHRLFA